MSQTLSIVILYENDLLGLVKRFDEILTAEGFLIEIDYKHDTSSTGWIPVMNGIIGNCHAGIEVRTETGYLDKSPRSLGEEIFVVRAINLPLYRTFAEFWETLDIDGFTD